MNTNESPQVADAFGKGSHDAQPGELKRLAASRIHDARCWLVEASKMLKSADSEQTGVVFIIGSCIDSLTRALEKLS